MRETSYPPSHGDLVQKSLTYIKENHPNYWKSITEDQRMEEAEADAARAEHYAQILISQGVFASDAWSRSIREMILGGMAD